LRARVFPSIQVVEQSGEGTDLVDLWQAMSVPTVYIIDAMISGLLPGTVRRFEAHDKPVPAQLVGGYSSHAFGLAQAIELARALDCLPSQLVIYAVEGRCFELGASLSSEVEMAARRVAKRIMAELLRQSAHHTLPTQS
jgi:hydrogenase maturation protease